jgi:alanyl-tRNA synthetase
VAALQDELKDARRRLKGGEGGAAGLPRPADLVASANEVAPGIRVVAATAPWASMDALKGAAKDIHATLGSGVIALGLEADEPQLFVTVSEDLVARGIAAGDLVRGGHDPLDGKGGGRPDGPGPGHPS